MDEKTLEALRNVESGLRRNGFRGHVYFLSHGKILMFTTTSGSVHGGAHNIGPRPLIDQVEHARNKAEAEAWFNRLRRSAPDTVPVPRTVWNSRHLVITGVSARHGLAWAFEHPRFYQESLLKQLADECGIESAEALARLFTRTTGRELPETSRRYFEERIMDNK